MLFLRRNRCIFCAFVALAWHSKVVASPAAATEQCPMEISRQQLSDIVFPGWLATVISPLRLHSVGFNDGPPSEMADLKPYSIEQRKSRSTVTWRFDEGPMLHGRWLSCGYGQDNAVTLAKQVSDATKTCIAYYTNGTLPNFNDIHVDCR
jgi:hypothetical protein